MFDALLNCVSASWSPTIGDPTVIGWVTVFFYAIAAFFSALVVLRSRGSYRGFWLLLAIFLLFLTVNKQLDLQSAFTAIGRCASKLQGWYDNRRAVQMTFILVFLTFSLTITLLVAWNMRRDLRQNGLALFGFALLMTFVAIRASSFHNFDIFISTELFGIRMNWLFELSGILLIILNASLLLTRDHNPSPKTSDRIRSGNDRRRHKRRAR